jgi:hypothetical protein
MIIPNGGLRGPEVCFGGRNVFRLLQGQRLAPQGVGRDKHGFTAFQKLNVPRHGGKLRLYYPVPPWNSGFRVDAARQWDGAGSDRAKGVPEEAARLLSMIDSLPAKLVRVATGDLGKDVRGERFDDL